MNVNFTATNRGYEAIDGRFVVDSRRSPIGLGNVWSLYDTELDIRRRVDSLEHARKAIASVLAGERDAEATRLDHGQDCERCGETDEHELRDLGHAVLCRDCAHEAAGDDAEAAHRSASELDYYSGRE